MKPKFELNQLLGVALAIVVLGIGTAFGLNVLSEIKSDFTASSAEANATQDAIDGVAKIPEKLPLIVTVVIAAIIIGIIVRFFAFK